MTRVTEKDRCIELLLGFVRYELCGIDLPESVRDFTPDELLDTYRLSKSQDLAHLVGDALLKCGLLEEGRAKATLKNEVILAVCRYERMKCDLDRAKSALDGAKVSYIALKGAVIRDLYPEPWMRTSCDIDLLVHRKDMQRAADALMAATDCKMTDTTGHDVAYLTASGTGIELHHSLIEDGRIAKADRVLSDIWDHVEKSQDGGEYEYLMPDEYFYYYHIVHMAKHLSIGGCGIRPIVDLYLLNKPSGADMLLKAGGLDRLEAAASELADCVMNDKKPSELAEGLKDYIFSAGIYGSVENYTAVKKSEKHGKIGFLLYRIFLPYKELRQIYPKLCGRPWLTPIYEVVRWVKFIADGRAKKGVREFDAVMGMSNERSDEVGKLMRELGVSPK